MDDAIEFVVFALLMIGAVMLLAVVLVLLTHPLSVRNCEVQGQSFEAAEYSFFGGCMVMHNGKWVPLKYWRAVDE